MEALLVDGRRPGDVLGSVQVRPGRMERLKVEHGNPKDVALSFEPEQPEMVCTAERVPDGVVYYCQNYGQQTCKISAHLKQR